MASKPTEFDPLFKNAGERYGVDPAVLKAIASVESDFRPDAVGPRTRSGQAQGMMQFIPATAKAYGLEDPFNPEKSVDAAARLMRDLTKQFNGDIGKALEAYNGGPSLVGKSSQTAKYREKVMQRAQLARKDPGFVPQGTKLAEKRGQRQKLPPAPRVALSSLEDMPVGYKAALALQYFTDTDPEGNPIDSAEEELAKLRDEAEYEQSASSGGGALLSKFFASQEKENVSPFDIYAGMQQPEAVDQEPPVQVAQGFADGGFVFRGTSLPGAPNWYLDPAADYTPEDRAMIERTQPILSGYNVAVEEYQKKVNQYNDLLDQWQKQADEYNKQVNAWNAGPRTSAFNPTVKNPGEFNVKFEAQEPKAPFDVDAYKAWLDLRTPKVEEARKRVEKEAPGRQLALDVVNDPNKYNLSGFGFKEGGDVNKRGMMEKIGQWLQDNEITPADFFYMTGRGIPLGMLLQPSEVNAGEEDMLRQLRESNKDIDNRMKEFDSQIMPDLGKPVGRSKGSGPNAEESLPEDDYSGMAEQMTLGTLPEGNKDALEKVAKDIARGSQYLPYDLLGGPVDVINLGLSPLGLGSEKPFLGSEYLIDKAVEAGIADKPTGSAAETATRIGMGFINPAQVVRSGVRLGETLGQKAVGATEGAIMPLLKAQTGNPELQPTDVYRAMTDTKGIASLAAPAAAPINKVQKVDPKAFISATEELDATPITPEVEQILDAHIGGVGNFGDPSAKYYLMHVPGGAEYTRQAQSMAQKYFGDQFMGYRLMPKEEFEALQSGDVGDLLSFSLSKDAANAFRKFAPNEGRKDLVLAEVPLTPSHVLGFGHRGEQEVIVDTSVGWSMDAFRRARPSLTPSEDYPFIGELERRVNDLSGPIKKQTLLGMLKGRPHDIRRAKEALEDFGSNQEIEPDQIISALRRTSPQRYRHEIVMPTEQNQKSLWTNVDNPYPNRPMGTVNLLLEQGKTEKQLNSLYDDVSEFRVNSSAAGVFRDPKNLGEYLGEIDKLADRVEQFDPQLAARTKIETRDTAEQVKPFVDLAMLRSYVNTPMLDPKNRWLIDWNDLGKTVPKEVKDLLQSRGITNITPEVATVAAKELAARNYLKEFNNIVTSGRLYLPRSITNAEKQLLGEMSSSPEGFLDVANNFKYYYEEMQMAQPKDKPELMLEISANLNSKLNNFDNVLALNKNEIIVNLRQLTQNLLDSDTLQSGKAYEGDHKGITKANPISFSRFVEVQPSDFVPARPQSAVLFTELQSDRRKAVKGSQKGVEEPYPSFVEDTDLLRELMVKSAVAGAAKLGKKIALFPGADSIKPELYGTYKTPEAKDKKDRSKYYPTTMKRIAEKVAKDLGEGYEAMEFYVKNGQGEPIARWGIVIPEDAAQTVPKKGIGFSKGGLVDKPLYDRA